jgi:hypothetical protein
MLGMGETLVELKQKRETLNSYSERLRPNYIWFTFKLSYPINFIQLPKKPSCPRKTLAAKASPVFPPNRAYVKVVQGK